MTQYRLDRIKDVTTSSMKDASERLESRLLEHRDAILQEANFVKGTIISADVASSQSDVQNSSDKNKFVVDTKDKIHPNSIIQQFDGILSQYKEIHRDILSSSKSLEKTALELVKSVPNAEGTHFSNNEVLEAKVGEIEDLIKTQSKDTNMNLNKLQKLVTANSDFSSPMMESTNKTEDCGSISVSSFLNINNINLLLTLSTLAVVVYSAVGRS